MWKKKLNKYFQIFKISFQQEFVYRLNFVMWRVRNVIQIFLIFFLWDTVFADPGRVVFGYDRAKILTYVFGILIIKAVVLSSRSIDIAGEISQGLLSNYLLKPIGYFKYWFVRDVSSKCLNLIFATIEVVLLFIVLRPAFFFQTNLLYLLSFIISAIFAIILFFLLMTIFNIFPLWYPEQAWGPTFLLLIFIEFLGGGTFPLDILPLWVQRVVYSTPFPYVLFVPLQIYLGKLDFVALSSSLMLAAIWIILLTFSLKTVWNLGLRQYRSEGR